MKRVVVLAVVAFLAGCSNAPLAGFLDNCFPSRAVGQKLPERRDPIRPGDRIPPPDLGGPVGPPAPGN